jgi:hypothetical protein
MAHTPTIIATAKGNATLLGVLLGSKVTDPSMDPSSPPPSPSCSPFPARLLCALPIKLIINFNVLDLGSKITPLFVAIQDLNIDCVRLLLENKADPNKRYLICLKFF